MEWINQEKYNPNNRIEINVELMEYLILGLHNPSSKFFWYFWKLSFSLTNAKKLWSNKR